MDTVDSAIAAVERQLRQGRDEVSRLERELAELLRKKWGVRPGSLVRVVGSRNPRIEGRLGRVAEVTAGSHDRPPWIKAYLELRPGVFSKAPRHLYSEWELVRDPDAG